jgi:hypothetical protein
MNKPLIALTVNATAMPYFHDKHAQYSVVYRADNAVVPHTDTVVAALANQFLATCRTGIVV